MKKIVTLIGGGDRDEVILQTAFAAASAGYIRRADDSASGLVETRHETQGYGVGAADLADLAIIVGLFLATTFYPAMAWFVLS